MKPYLVYAFAVYALSLPFNASAIGSIELVENAIESQALNIRLSNDLSGVVTGKQCDRCETEVVKITPQTKLFVNGVPADLIDAKVLSGKPGTAIFNIKTREVSKIKIQK